VRTPLYARVALTLGLSILLLLGLAATVASAAPTATQADIVINELDADQVSTDAAEFIELYDGGDGNTDLTGLVLVLHNGSDDASYAAFDLDGYATDANGYFVLCGDSANTPNCDLDVGPDTNLIQNGADAAALYTGDAVDFPTDTPVTTTNLIDAIVYGTDDPDDPGLLVLLNPGQPQVDEYGGGAGTLHSNQRCPNGAGGARNTDTYTQALPTPGLPNACPIELPGVLINELDADQVSTDSAEFIELFDGGDGNTDLTGLVLVLHNGSDDASYGAFDLDGYATNANGYFVLCANAATTPGCDLDVSPDTNLIQNGADAAALYVGDAVDFPTDTPVTTTNLIDAIVYGTDDPDDPGILVLLNPGQPQVDEYGGGDGTAHSNQRCPNGTGGARNTNTYTQTLPTPGLPNCPVELPDVLINELDADQVDTDAAEFVELFDGGIGYTDLTGLTLVLYNGSSDTSYQAFDLDGYTTGAGGYFVLCGDSANTPNCDLDVSPDTNLIQNGADAAALYVADGADFPNGTALTTANVVDAIVYDTDDDDDPGLLALLNPGQPQVNERGGGDGTAHSSQRCPNGTGGQRNTDTYGQYPPTPGATNACILPDIPPTVASTTPADGATQVPLNASIIVQFSEPVATNPGWFDLSCSISGPHTAAVSGGPQAYTLNPDADFVISDTCTLTAFGPLVVDLDGDPDPMASDHVITFNTLAPTCGMPATPIHEIQGSGTASPLDGATRTIEGIVVGDFQSGTNLSGFFLQEEDGDADADPTTSEGIFVYDGYTPAVDVSVGDTVRVTGTVDEFFDLTELTNVSDVEICPPTGTASPAAVALPIPALADWEHYEGMLVDIPQTLYATGNYNQGRYGEVDLSVGGRLVNPTNVVEPGAAAQALQELNDRSRIQLEDGRTSQNPIPPAYIGEGGTLRAGDTLPELTGVVHYAFGAYEIHPTDAISFTRANAREAVPADPGGSLEVASFNVLNYFTTLDGSGDVCGPSQDMGCRGADTADELIRQRDKIVSAIVGMDADVVGLIEIENHVNDAALIDLVDSLNAVGGAGTWARVDTGTVGTDAIKVAFIYQPRTVTPVGAHAILDASVDPMFIDTKNRPALAQTFQENTTGEAFTAVVNHLKSKGSDCNDIGDPDLGDGQGNCNVTRTNAARALVNWLSTDPTNSGDPDFLIVGDLNSYAMEDPIDALKAGGYTDLLSEHLQDAYSYVFAGQAGYLDHALANATLADQVAGVTVWHINADEPSALNYNDYNQPELYQPDPYRASDHDPVIVGLSLRPYTIFVPIVAQNLLFAPDLVIDSLVVTADEVQVTISNQGNAPSMNDFWVDVYLDPLPAPTEVNQLWSDLGTQGLVWGVTAPVAPGETILLTTAPGGYYLPEYGQVTWPLAPSTVVYAQVDVYNATTAHGAVLERHEILSDAYNNVFGPVVYGP